MIIMKCDGCGKELPQGTLRYRVNMDVRAAYDEMEITLIDLVQDHRDEIRALIRQMEEKNATELEEQVYKKIELDLCPRCQKIFIQSPLHFHPEHQPPKPPVDIDEFLRSLGIGKPRPDEK